jgi:beta-galactosidase
MQFLHFIYLYFKLYNFRMNRAIIIILILVAISGCNQKRTGTTGASDRNVPFDNGWLFTKDSVPGAEVPDYNDSKWRLVDLPHDWSIEDLPEQTPGIISGPFDKTSIGSYSTGFSIGGTGWYRKKFVTAKEQKDKLVSIYFDGVYMNSDVWLNGNYLGNHPNGYTPFCYDLTPYLKPSGQENVLAVRVRNEGRNSRWYSGSGIYRHVWLIVTGQVHIAPAGVFVTTPEVSEDNATVLVKSTIKNEASAQSDITLVTAIISPEGKTVSQTRKDLIIGANAIITDDQSIKLTKPALWSVETPLLYRVVTEIKKGNKTSDRFEATFGIRSIHFDATSGLTINGRRILLKGGCIHHDNGPLGAVSNDRAEERKIEILKANGFNAIRTSHNPPSIQLLDACDRLGMLVIDEAFDAWEVAKMPEDYHLYFKEWWKKDIEAFILRDRNHPSVIIWSIGNEITERVDTSGLRITRQLVDAIRILDPTRPVTEALCQYWEPVNAGKQWSASAPAYALLDIGGYNYQMREYESDHKQYPNRIMMGTESYPSEALENWNLVEKNPYIIGDFVWTAFDYLGEASIGHSTYDTIKKSQFSVGWPWYNSWCGDIDITGNKKPQSYYRDIVWRNSPVAMAVHEPIPEGLIENTSGWGWPNELQSWTWPGAEGKSLVVRVFSRAPKVRLLLNGIIIGEQEIKEGSITALFNVPYQPGTLKAFNVENGRETDSIEFRTTGSPKRIKLTADRATITGSRNDLSYVTVEVVDNNDQVVPAAEIPIQFFITGAGEIAAVGNADPTDLSSFQKPERKTFRGKCLVIIRPSARSGIINLKATANGLSEGQITINVLN